MTGTGIFSGSFLRRDRWMLLVVVARRDAALLSQAPSANATLRDPGGVRPGCGEHGDNTAFVAMTGPARALDTDRRSGRLAGDGVRRDRRWR